MWFVLLPVHASESDAETQNHHSLKQLEHFSSLFGIVLFGKFGWWWWGGEGRLRERIEISKKKAREGAEERKGVCLY